MYGTNILNNLMCRSRGGGGGSGPSCKIPVSLNLHYKIIKLQKICFGSPPPGTIISVGIPHDGNFSGSAQ